MPLIDLVQQDMVAAMKSKQEARLSAIRMIKAALMKYKVDNPTKPLDEASEMSLLKMLMKQRTEAADILQELLADTGLLSEIAPELMALARFRDLYTFLQYSGYTGLID